ncbi:MULTISPECIES: NAD(+) kinase [unclassified Acinetobacter]|uniref:NAD(+) kinase n=1 Tax=unclassified Acinetobacter TaxID=196816 RepID=UPI0035BAF375
MQLQAKSFRNVGLIGRPGKVSVIETLHMIYDFLIQQGLHPIFDEDTAKMCQLENVQTCRRAHMGLAADVVIVVGGDGTLLRAARIMARHNVPVIGVNRGRLGFLTDISPKEVLQKLEMILRGEFVTDQRFLLETEIRSDNNVIYHDIALNDVVLHGKSVNMIDFELYIDGLFVCRQHSDGLILSSPTGSTAYALSGGGPIVHPNINAMVIVPMHPHTLTSRPIVVGGNSEIKIKVCENHVLAMVSADGQASVSLHVGDWLYVRKHPFKLTLLHPPGYDFYAACRTKLGWNSGDLNDE